MKTERGFTLIELLCVLAIVGTLAVVSVGQYSRITLRSKVQLGRSCVAQISLAMTGQTDLTIPTLVCVAQLQPEYFVFDATRDSQNSAAKVTASPTSRLDGMDCAQMSLSGDGTWQFEGDSDGNCR